MKMDGGFPLVGWKCRRFASCQSSLQRQQQWLDKRMIRFAGARFGSRSSSRQRVSLGGPCGKARVDKDLIERAHQGEIEEQQRRQRLVLNKQHRCLSAG